MSVTVLAPAYNEEAVIADFVAAVVPALQTGWELLVVDDGSADATPKLLAELAEQHDALRVVTHERNKGMGAALATGFQAAEGDIVVTMDADLSHPLELLPVLVGVCEQGADACFGSRYVPGGGMVGIARKRVLISQVANLVLRLVFWTRVRDLTTGLRAYRAEAVRPLRIVGTGFETQLEISIRLVAAGRRIEERPLMLTDRAAGESKMSYLKLVPRYWRTVVLMLRIRWGRSGARSRG